MENTGVVDFLYNVVSALKYGFSANVQAGPYLQGMTIQPVQEQPQRSSLLPWLLFGGLGLVVLVWAVSD